jgi:hypothetical protein
MERVLVSLMTGSTANPSHDAFETPPHGDATSCAGAPGLRGNPGARELAWKVVIEAVWFRRQLPDLDRTSLRRALRLAISHHVEGVLLDVYEARLPHEKEEWRSWSRTLQRNLSEAAAALLGAGLTPVLIKADTDQYSYGNFDVLVRVEEWDAAVEALRARGWRSSRWFLEPDKLLIFPSEGPFVHLHRAVSWFAIPVISATTVLRRSQLDAGCPLPVPAPVDSLRMWLAHASFQNLRFDLSELLALRPLLVDDLLERARDEASAEGWSRGFDVAKDAAMAAVRHLDHSYHGCPQLRLPSLASLGSGFEHAAHLFRRGHLEAAARETLLRPVLVARKAAGSIRSST